MASLVIATRESKLALWQANFIRDELNKAHPDLNVTLKGITTRGDRWLKSPLSEIGGKGLFIKELEAAMLEGEADIAVHSVKDLPAEVPEEFDLPVIAYREEVNDVLVSGSGDVSELPAGAKVGSSSLRRKAQLLAMRPDLNILPIRGNVDTRLGKLDAGEFDAIVLAAAGLNRLGLKRDDVHVIPVEVMLPAPGQAALAIECRAGDSVVEWLQPLMDPAVDRLVRAERAISLGLGADCSLPIAALGQWEDTRIRLQALVASEDGKEVIRGESLGTDPDDVAGQVMDQLRGQGVDSLLGRFTPG